MSHQAPAPPKVTQFNAPGSPDYNPQQPIIQVSYVVAAPGEGRTVCWFGACLGFVFGVWAVCCVMCYPEHQRSHYMEGAAMVNCLICLALLVIYGVFPLY